MLSNRRLNLLFSVAGLILLAFLCWGGFIFYGWQAQRTNEKILAIIKATAISMQEENLTVSNFARLFDDSELNEKIAFAAGVMGNTGKMRIWFDENEKEAQKMVTAQNIASIKAGTDTVVHINIGFVKEKNTPLKETAKTISDFKPRLKSQLDSAGLNINFHLVRETPLTDRTKSKFHYSSPEFIINFYDPEIYRVEYDIPSTVLLIRILPYVILCAVLCCLFFLSYRMLIKSYRLQLQMLRFREGLFSNITHELKTPLSSLQIIFSYMKDSTRALTQEHVLFAQNELKRVQLLVDRIISFGKMDRQDFELNKSVADLYDVVAEAIGASRLVLENTRAELLLNAPETPVKIALDRSLFVNAIMTIIDNAIKYSVGPPHITIDILREEHSVLVQVTDRGIGIPASFHKNIFDPFFRVPSPGSRQDSKGDGLGLSYVMQVLELHKGNVKVVSEPGKGSTFSLIIPSK